MLKLHDIYNLILKCFEHANREDGPHFEYSMTAFTLRAAKYYLIILPPTIFITTQLCIIMNNPQQHTETADLDKLECSNLH